MRGWILAGVLTGVLACSSFQGEAPTTGSDAAVDAGVDGAEAGPVTGSQGDYGLSITPVPSTLSLLPGQTATVKVTIVRGANQTADVRLAVSGLPAGFTPPDVTIPSGSSTGALPIVVPSTPTPGAVSAQIVATAVTTDPNAAASAVTPLHALVHGKAGDVDTTFGTNGKTTDLLASPKASIVKVLSAPDGSLYAVGTTGSATAVSHLADDGKRDTAYGGSTIAIANPKSAALQKDGKIVIVGTGLQGAAIGRVDAKGNADSGFTAQLLGTGASTVATGGLSGSNDQNVDVAVRSSDGAIFVAFDNTDGSTAKAGQLRFESNGALHVTYGAGGGVRHLNGRANGILVRNNLASASVGSVTVTSVGQGFYGFTQQTGDDGVDSAAGAQPKTTSVSFLTTRGAYPIAIGIVELADGSVVTPINDDGAFYLRKFDPVGGAPATTFGTAGLAGPFTFNALALGIAAQPDGKVLVLTNAGLNATLFRFNTDGTPDSSFGSGGSISFSFNNNYPPSVAAGADRIIVSYVDSATTTSTLASFWQ